MLGRFRRGGDAEGKEVGWALAIAPSGDLLVALPSPCPPMATPVVTVGPDGEISIGDVGGRKEKWRLRRSPGDTKVAAVASVLVAAIGKGGPVFTVAPVVRKSQKPQALFSRGRIHRAEVERVVDDGLATGVWRGFIAVFGGPSDVFVELAPPMPLVAGTEVRFVGNLEPSDHRIHGQRLKPGAWVPVEDRVRLFAASLTTHVIASDGDDGGTASAAMAACLREIATLHHLRSGSRADIPFTAIRGEEVATPAQRGLRDRLLAWNAGQRRQRLDAKGRRMSLAATDWHGAVQKNGDVIIEIRLAPFEIQPASMTVIVNGSSVVTSDGLPTRLGVRCVFPDGAVVTMLLGGGPQNIADEIAKRSTVLVVQGEPGAKTYAEVAMSVAGVEKR